MVEPLPHSDLLKRPEAVVLVLLSALLILWDTYLALLDEAEGSMALSSRQLAERLGTTTRILRRCKSQPAFSEWTRQLDPDGIAWVYSAGGTYIPIEVASQRV
jgi:hypothetical protein